MKAAAFCIERPHSVAQALERAAVLGERARWLAGGQSLLPAMALRLACPEVLIDLGALEALRGVREAAGAVRVGALTTYREAQAHALLRQQVPLLAQAIALVAHPAIRNAGTLGGSVALADPAAEMPAVCLALDAQIVVQGGAGERRIAAEDFFRGFYDTALQAGELLVAIEYPKATPGTFQHIDEIARRRGDYASAGLVVHGARHVLFGVSSRPVLLPADGTLDTVDFFGDLRHPPAMKAHLARVLLQRADARRAGAMH